MEGAGGGTVIRGWLATDINHYGVAHRRDLGDGLFVLGQGDINSGCAGNLTDVLGQPSRVDS
jgi:hypothetical protein